MCVCVCVSNDHLSAHGMYIYDGMWGVVDISDTAHISLHCVCHYPCVCVTILGCSFENCLQTCQKHGCEAKSCALCCHINVSINSTPSVLSSMR